LRESLIASIADDLPIIITLVVITALLITSHIPWYYVVPALAVLTITSIALYKGAKAQLRPPIKGLDELRGLVGTVVEVSRNSLLIRIDGELWRAKCLSECIGLRPGLKVKVVGVEGSELVVKVIE